MASANILRIHVIPQPKPWCIAPIPKAFGRLLFGNHTLSDFEVLNGAIWIHCDTGWSYYSGEMAPEFPSLFIQNFPYSYLPSSWTLLNNISFWIKRYHTVDVRGFPYLSSIVTWIFYKCILYKNLCEKAVIQVLNAGLLWKSFLYTLLHLRWPYGSSFWNGELKKMVPSGK
jgi:hypothetical protein